jgi:hypothetical protein
MAEITIDDQDRAAAETFMVSVVSPLYPDADYTPGSVTRDHTIGALSALFAVLRGESADVRRATSLKLVSELTNADDFAAAVENIVANWYVTKRAGREARGSAVIHFSAPHSGTIPYTTTFTREAGLGFVMDTTLSTVYAESDLIPRIDPDGTIIDYTFRVPVIAEAPGTEYEIEPGTFAFMDKFNRFVLFAENDYRFSGATNTETPEELLERVPVAITVRDLNSDRSIATVLGEEFGNLDNIVVVGMGDDGMRRDLALFTSGIEMHLGGYMDVYVAAPLSERRVYEGIVGGTFTDVREGVTLFRDPTVLDWRATAATKGDILRIRNAGASENSRYVIEEVTKYHLRVAFQQEFPGVRPLIQRDGVTLTDGSIGTISTLSSTSALFSALDLGRYIRVTSAPTPANLGDYQIISVSAGTNTVTLNTAALTVEGSIEFEIYEGLVEYSIGDFGPDYQNKVAPATTGEFTRVFQRDGQVLLPAEPIYRIHEVSILDPEDADTDPVSGRVQFPNRVNHEPVAASGSSLEYTVTNSALQEAQSAYQMFAVDVGHANEQSGVGGYFFGANFFEAPGAVFTADDIGKLIYTPQAVNAVNRGEHRIIAVGGPTTVELDDPDGGAFTSVAETRLAWDLSNKTKYDGKVCRVVYDTIAGFDAVHTYVADRQVRVSCANTLVRGDHPVYLSFELRYTLLATANAFFNVAAAKDALVTFINTFPTDQILDASDIVTEFRRQNATEVGKVQLPVVIDYTLYAPDGRAIPYSTDDVVEVAALRLSASAAEDRLDEPINQGVVDQNVRYLSSVDLITLTELT